MGIYTSTNLIEEALESGAAIGFSTNVIRVLTNDNFNKFIGYGGYTPKDVSDYRTIFSGVEVSKDAGKWTYEGASKYWVKDAAYKFYAHNCENMALTKCIPEFATTGSDAGAFNITDFVCNKGHQHDLIYAESGTITGKETGNSAVSSISNICFRV